MGCCVTCGNAKCSCPGFTILDGPALDHTLVSSLTCVVDSVRDIATCLGARPYQVSLIWTRWSGGHRGAGIEEVLKVEHILPTPLVDNLNKLSNLLQTIGTMETGGLHISQISARYTEDYLMGRDERGRSVPEDQSFYWEVYFPQASKPGIRRRFTVKAAPNLNSTRAEWTVDLVRAYDDRGRSGNIR